MYSAPPTWAKPGPALSLSLTHSLVLPYLSLSLSAWSRLISLSHTHTQIPPYLSLTQAQAGPALGLSLYVLRLP